MHLRFAVFTFLPVEQDCRVESAECLVGVVALSLMTSANRRYGTLAAKRLYSARALQLDINLLTATFPIAPMPSTARSLTPH